VCAKQNNVLYLVIAQWTVNKTVGLFISFRTTFSVKG
jgi:hypothetical protein